MEEVGILTISMLFILIYLYSIFCIYFDILLYDALQLLHPYNRPSIPIDSSMSISTTHEEVEETYKFGVMNTKICVKFDKFTIVISLFYGILKFIFFLSL